MDINTVSRVGYTASLEVVIVSITLLLRGCYVLYSSWVKY